LFGDIQLPTKASDLDLLRREPADLLAGLLPREDPGITELSPLT